MLSRRYDERGSASHRALARDAFDMAPPRSDGLDRMQRSGFTKDTHIPRACLQRTHHHRRQCAPVQNREPVRRHI